MPADLVVFGEDWGAHPSSTQHLISHLKRDRRVLWVNSIGLRRPRLTFRDFGRMARKVRAMGQTTMPTAAGEPTVINPRVLPLPGNAIARSLNRRLLGGRLRATMAERGFNRPILWTSLPTAVDNWAASRCRNAILRSVDQNYLGTLDFVTSIGIGALVSAPIWVQRCISRAWIQAKGRCC